jgi:ZIP family zinc transporter
MNAVLLAALTSISTSLGGLFTLRTKDRFHLVLGLSAGLLLGLVAFDLNPTIYAHMGITWGGLPAVPVAFCAGFLILHFIEKWVGGHEGHSHHYEDEHTHSDHVAGVFGAVAMAGHVFMDGVALGVAFHVSHALGVAVFFALLVHAFSDGLNTVAMLVKAGSWSQKAISLLAVDAIVRISGAIVGNSFHLSENSINIYLAFFSGFVIYIATSHILPEAHANHPSRFTMAATALGVAIMWVVVRTLG